MKHLKERIILAFLDNELKEGQRKNAEEHFAVCPSCRNQKGLLLEKKQFIKNGLELLTPERVSQSPSFNFHGSKSEIYAKPYFRRLVLASVRVPVAIFAMMWVALLAMAIVLFSRKGESRVSENLHKEEAGRITLVCQESRMSFSIGVKLTGFLPITNPRLIITGEDKR
jgi:hypothetical protein